MAISLPALPRSASVDPVHGQPSRVARYLYHWQERGLLIPLYRAFLAHQPDDQTGLKSLIQVLGTDDLTTFRAEWEAARMKLELP